MKFTQLPNSAQSRDIVNVFGGYNHTMQVAAGEWYDMENMTSKFYPLMSPRGKRGFFGGGSNIRCLLAKDQLCYADGSNIVIGDSHYDLGLTAENTNLVSMGAYIICMPDKKYINTSAPEDRGNIEQENTAAGASLRLCKANGEEYEQTTVGDTAPETAAAGDYWLDTSATAHALKVYGSGIWSSVATTYVCIQAEGIGSGLQEGDGVTISGLDGAAEGLNGSCILQAAAEDWIVIVGLIDETVSVEGAVSVSRTMPIMDYVIESGNRLWGCRYGENAAGEQVNELYASKLGDFKNWNVFQGISTDSYIASLGSDGYFTGAINHLGYPLFFKEGTMHKVYGSIPSSYQIQSDTCRGVQKGSHKSLAIVGETLFYKSRTGVCAYDGSLPTEVSQALGDVAYHNAVAGSHGRKYYISMADGDGKYHLFVYDTQRGLWHREDNTQALGFASYGNDLYYIDAADANVYTMLGTGGSTEGAVQWFVESGIIGTDDPDQKYLNRLQIRMRMELNSVANVYIEYDSSGSWEYAGTMRGTRTGSCTMPIKPRRCDHLRMKIQGSGDVKIFSIAKTIS